MTMKTPGALRLLPLLALVPISLAVADGAAKKPTTARSTSQEHLFKLGVALLQYSDDYDGHLPPMADAQTAHQALLGYALEADFYQPGTTALYAPNPALSGQKHADYSKDQIVAFYATTPAEDSEREVLFLPPFDPKIVHWDYNSEFVKDYIKFLPENAWQKVNPKLSKR